MSKPVVEFKTDIDVQAELLRALVRDFPPAAYGVIRDLQAEVLEEVLAVWPKASASGGRSGAARKRIRAFKSLGSDSLVRHVGRHPYATGESRKKMRVGKTKKGINVRNKAMTSKGEMYFGYVLKTPNRRNTGLIHRIVPEIIEKLDDKIRKNFTRALYASINPITQPKVI